MTTGSSTTFTKNPAGHAFMHGGLLVSNAEAAAFVFRGCQ